MIINKHLTNTAETIEKTIILNDLLIVRRALNILIADILESNEKTLKKDDIKRYYLYLLKSLLWQINK